MEKMRIAYKQNECRENIDDILLEEAVVLAVLQAVIPVKVQQVFGLYTCASSGYGSGTTVEIQVKDKRFIAKNLAIKHKRN